MTVLNRTTGEYTSPSQSVVINIPNAVSIQSVTTNTGTVSGYNLSGENLTIQLNSGAVTRTGYVTADELINFSYQNLIDTAYGYNTEAEARTYANYMANQYNTQRFINAIYPSPGVACYAIDATYVYVAYDGSGGSPGRYHAQWQMGRYTRHTISTPQNYYQYNLAINYTVPVPRLSPVEIDRYIVECQFGLQASYIGTSQNTWVPNVNSTWQKIYEGPSLSYAHYAYNQSILFYRVKAIDKNGNVSPYIYSPGILKT